MTKNEKKMCCQQRVREKKTWIDEKKSIGAKCLSKVLGRAKYATGELH
jgi:hypothetical protein